MDHVHTGSLHMYVSAGVSGQLVITVSTRSGHDIAHVVVGIPYGRVRSYTLPGLVNSGGVTTW
jgi:hypothetical protein